MALARRRGLQYDPPEGQNPEYGVDILKGAINREGILPLWVSFPVLLLFATGLFLFSLRNIKRKWVL